MKTMISTMALIAGLGLSAAAVAQAVPSGGPDAKGNSPLKNAHTVNDGAAKPGATSFTEAEARKHLEHSGYTSPQGLMKGKDGVWRGSAMKGGAKVNVGLDFKGNVTEGGPVVSASMPSDGKVGAAGHPTAPLKVAVKTKHRHHGVACATPGPKGVACSGPDKNKNGISDKEDHAIKAGAKP
jgi:hypothetical protein